jgi:hypothetical protein
LPSTSFSSLLARTRKKLRIYESGWGRGRRGKKRHSLCWKWDIIFGLIVTKGLFEEFINK